MSFDIRIERYKYKLDNDVGFITIYREVLCEPDSELDELEPS
ncbi:MAG: hypothetical protein ACLFTH_02660 [Candidatus Woesearchaeota archaeon]